MVNEAGVGASLQDLSAVDRLVHEPARLMILLVLYAVEAADFTFLSNATQLTDGNLSSHLNKLEGAGYVAIEKSFSGKKPRTSLSLTSAGRQAVDDYRRTMSQALKNLDR